MHFQRMGVISFFICSGIFIGSLSSAPSSLTGNLFVLQRKNVQSFAINKTFTENTQTDVVRGEGLACAMPSTVYGASVDAKIELLNEASLVRFILIDQYGNEFMIYEINSLLAENTSFSIADVCHETKLLDAVNPASLRVDILAATVTLQNASFVTEAPCSRGEISTLKEQIQADQHQRRIDLYNKMIKLKGEEWIAGPTEISMKTYQEKKCYYLGGENNPLPNTQGSEFYAGGVMPSRTNTPPAKITIPKESMYADTFDWRNRHGAIKSSSPYFNSSQNGSYNGWCTPIRRQGNCGSCYIFSSVAEAEIKYNLYYNQQIDMDLSEQFVGSCHSRYAGKMCNGGIPDQVSSFMVSDGITDEEGFEYTASNSTECRDSADNSEEHAFFASYKRLKRNEVNNWEDLKKCIIKYGPLASADLSMSHAMGVVGYQQRGDEFITIYKNSWGGSGDRGYMYKASPYNQSSWAAFDMTKPEALISYLYTDDDIRCVDLDGDGYYNWGIGPKPATCPEGCPDEIDCDDSDPGFGPYIDSTGRCQENTTGQVPSKSSFPGLKYTYHYDPIMRASVIRFNAPDNASASVTIYKLSGTRVKKLAVNKQENGSRKAVWNSAGSPVSKGIYLCTICIDNAGTDTKTSFKIAVVR